MLHLHKTIHIDLPNRFVISVSFTAKPALSKVFLHFMKRFVKKFRKQRSEKN